MVAFGGRRTIIAFCHARAKITVEKRGQTWDLQQPEIDPKILALIENNGCPLRDFKIGNQLRTMDHGSWFFIGFLYNPVYNFSLRDKIYLCFFYRMIVNNPELLMDLVRTHGVAIVKPSGFDSAEFRDALSGLRDRCDKARGGGSGGFCMLYKNTSGPTIDCHVKYFAKLSTGYGFFFETMENCNCSEGRAPFDVIKKWDKENMDGQMQGFMAYQVGADLGFLNKDFYDRSLLMVGSGCKTGVHLYAQKELRKDLEYEREIKKMTMDFNNDLHMREILKRLCPVFPPGTTNENLLADQDTQNSLCETRKFAEWVSASRGVTLTGVQKPMGVSEFNLKRKNGKFIKVAVQRYKDFYIVNGQKASKYVDGVRVNKVDDEKVVEALVENAGWIRGRDLI